MFFYEFKFFKYELNLFSCFKKMPVMNELVEMFQEGNMATVIHFH